MRSPYLLFGKKKRTGVFAPASTGNMSILSAEVHLDGRLLVVYFQGTTPTNWGVPDYLPGKQRAKSCHLSGVSQLAFAGSMTQSNVPMFVGGTFTAATKTLTKTGAFANYRAFQSGDQIGVIQATGAGLSVDTAFAIASRVSDDAITLTTSFGGDGTNVVCSAMPAGQGTKIIWPIGFWIVNDSECVDALATGLTFSAAAGLIQDVYGNSTAAVQAFPVTNNSLCESSTGMISSTAFTRASGGVRLFVATAPFGSDAKTFAQAQSMSTPLASVNQAKVLAAANAQDGKACNISILQGTVQTSHIQCVFNGAGRLQPFLLDSYWDGGISGQGAQNVRPIINSDGNAPIASNGGGGSPSNCSFIVAKDLELVGTSGVNCVNCFLSFGGDAGYGMVLGNCVLRNAPIGFNVQRDVNNATNGLMNRCGLIRCILKDLYSGSAGHTQGSYTYGTKNFLRSQCTYEYTGRQNADGAAMDIFSRAVYDDSESEFSSTVCCFFSRGDAIQARAGGIVYGNVFTQCPVMVFLGKEGGSVRLNYNQLGGDFGTTVFTNATYTHLTRTLALTGIGTSMAPPVCVWLASGTGVTPGYYRVSSTPTADSIIIQSPGLGAGADGQTNIGGVKMNVIRGFGPQTNSGSDIDRCQPMLIEQNVGAYLGTYGSDPRAIEIPGKDTRYPLIPHVLERLNYSRQSGPTQLDGDNTNTPPVRVDRYQNVFANHGTTQNVVRDATSFASWAFLHSNNNVFTSDAASPFLVGGVAKTLAQYRTITGQEANSITTTPTVGQDGAMLEVFAVASGIGTTEADLRNAWRTRGMTEWRACDKARDCVLLLIGKYAVTNLAAVGVAPANFQGAGATDIAVYG